LYFMFSTFPSVKHPSPPDRALRLLSALADGVVVVPEGA
jgi:hypothetical protein